ncbi:MAG: glutaredoxin family protein [Candidatus Pacebacteria bacterium]|nr:glutaredoxin family protein [Candidatus Paceibacterota bacterium]
MANKIKVYSTPACPYCHLLKEYLKEKGVEFEDIDVSQNENALQELVQKTGQMVVPVIDIDGEIVIGFDKEKIDRLLKITQ